MVKDILREAISEIEKELENLGELRKEMEQIGKEIRKFIAFLHKSLNKA